MDIRPCPVSLVVLRRHGHGLNLRGLHEKERGHHFKCRTDGSGQQLRLSHCGDRRLLYCVRSFPYTGSRRCRSSGRRHWTDLHLFDGPLCHNALWISCGILFLPRNSLCCSDLH
ncbi:MAG: hypothetical protein DRN35_06015, partial [Thermoplasmata archaeon]